MVEDKINKPLVQVAQQKAALFLFFVGMHNYTPVLLSGLLLVMLLLISVGMLSVLLFIFFFFNYFFKRCVPTV